MATRRTIIHSALALLACGAGPALAQHGDRFPSGPIKIIVPNTPGTTVDLVARLFAEKLGQRVKQQVIVDNKPGSGGVIAAQAAAKSPADGYTLLFVNSQHAINPTAYEKLPYDTVKDFEGVVLVGDTPSVVAVPVTLGVHTMAEFVALGKRKPGGLAYASAGIGSQTHLSGAFFAKQAGMTMTHVPYRSANDVITDLVGNRTQVTFAPTAFVQSQIQSGKLMALAVTGRQRLPNMPNVPTVSETVLPGYEFTTWLGFVAPARTPAPVMALLAREMQAVAEDPAVRQAFVDQGITPRILALKDFDAYVKSEIARLAPVVASSGVKQ